MAWVPVAQAGVQMVGEAAKGPNSAEGRQATYGTTLDGSGWVVNFSGTQNASTQKTQKDDYSGSGLGDSSGLPSALGAGMSMPLLMLAAAAVVVVIIKRKKG